MTLRLLSFGIIAWFVFDWAPQFMSHSGGLEPLDARFGYSVAEAEALLAALGDEGRVHVGARAMLAGATVDRAAAETGFASNSAFSLAFRKELGAPPARWVSEVRR